MTEFGDKPFWKAKGLEELTSEEWESLCDRCGKCCLQKLEDEDTGSVFYTNVACRLLDTESCRCLAYADRTELISDCLVLTPEKYKTISWLPITCAYRIVAENRDLEWWHHLVSGQEDTVHSADMSVRNKIIPEKHADPDNFEAYIVDVKIC